MHWNILLLLQACNAQLVHLEKPSHVLLNRLPLVPLSDLASPVEPREVIWHQHFGYTSRTRREKSRFLCGEQLHLNIPASIKQILTCWEQNFHKTTLRCRCRVWLWMGVKGDAQLSEIWAMIGNCQLMDPTILSITTQIYYYYTLLYYIGKYYHDVTICWRLTIVCIVDQEE